MNRGFLANPPIQLICVLERTSAEARVLARSFDDQRHNFVFGDFI